MQTVGKAALGIKIVTMDDRNADFGRIVARRLLPVVLMTMIPVVGSLLRLLDDAAIFGNGRRCIHDRLAGTRVVRV